MMAYNLGRKIRKLIGNYTATHVRLLSIIMEAIRSLDPINGLTALELAKYAQMRVKYNIDKLKEGIKKALKLGILYGCFIKNSRYRYGLNSTTNKPATFPPIVTFEPSMIFKECECRAKKIERRKLESGSKRKGQRPRRRPNHRRKRSPRQIKSRKRRRYFSRQRRQTRRKKGYIKKRKSVRRKQIGKRRRKEISKERTKKPGKIKSALKESKENTTNKTQPAENTSPQTKDPPPQSKNQVPISNKG